MGVLGLFPWILKNFPDYFEELLDGQYRGPDMDYLHIDGNAGLHPAAQLVWSPAGLVRYGSLTYTERREKCFSIFVESIIAQVHAFRPKVLFIATDGPAPLAKQSQQRGRRYVTALTTNAHRAPFEPDGYDSSQITPGTKFMYEFTKYMNYRLRELVSGPWKGIKVIFSPPSVPGEGEHKILSYIRGLGAAKPARHCIVGPDGDLVMLTMAAMVPLLDYDPNDPTSGTSSMFWYRPDQNNVEHYHLFNMSAVTEALPSVLRSSRHLSDVVADFVLTSFFVGNDFLPKIQMFHRLREGFELMIQDLRRLPQGEGITTNGAIAPTNFAQFIKSLAEDEEKYLIQQLHSSSIPGRTGPEDPRFKNVTLEQYSVVDASGTRFDYAGYRQAYYRKAGVKKPSEIRKMCQAYIKGLAFVSQYYMKKLPSWTFFYPYQYAPMMRDVVQELGQTRSVKFSKGRAPEPFVQLLCVLPPAASYNLPEQFRWLLTSKKSPIVKKGMAPKTFKIDYEGVTAEHAGKPLIPFVKLKTITTAYEEVASRILNEDGDRFEFARNARGKDQVFTYRPSKRHTTYKCKYGTLREVKVKVKTL